MFSFIDDIIKTVKVKRTVPPLSPMTETGLWRTLLGFLDGGSKKVTVSSIPSRGLEIIRQK